MSLWPPPPQCALQQSLLVLSLTDCLSDWQTCLLSDWVWLGATGLKLSLALQPAGRLSPDQSAEEKPISIKLKHLPVCFKQLQTGESLSVYGWHISLQTDRQTEGERQGGLEMSSADLFYGIETSVKCCKYLYINLPLCVAPGVVIVWKLGLSGGWRMRLQSQQYILTSKTPIKKSSVKKSVKNMGYRIPMKYLLGAYWCVEETKETEWEVNKFVFMGRLRNKFNH